MKVRKKAKYNSWRNKCLAFCIYMLTFVHLYTTFKVYIKFILYMQIMCPSATKPLWCVVITGRANCFHDYIYITLTLLLSDLSTVCVVDHWLNISSCYGSISLILGLIWMDGGLSTLCYSCGFACQQRVLKTFSGARYLRSEDGVVYLWLLLVNFYIWLIILSYYGSISLTLALIWGDGGLSTLCHSCGFAC